MTFDKSQQVVVSYVLDELTPKKRAEFDRHLETDAQLQQDIKALTEAAEISKKLLSNISSPAFQIRESQREEILKLTKSVTEKVPIKSVPPEEDSLTKIGQSLFQAPSNETVPAQTSATKGNAAAVGTGSERKEEAPKEDAPLFSLANLASLDQMGQSSNISSEETAGAVDSETSGMRDMRKMIVGLDGKTQSSIPSAPKERSLISSIPPFDASFNPSFGTPAMPHVDRADRQLMFWRIAAGVGFLSTLIVSIVLIFTLSQPNTGSQDKQISALMSQLEKMQSGNRGVNSGESNSGEEKVAAPTQKPPKETPQTEIATNTQNKAPREKTPAAKPSTSTPVIASAPAPTPKKNSELDALLGGSAPKKKKPAASAAGKPSKKAKAGKSPATNGGGGKKLTRSQVLAGMSAVKGSVKRCSIGKTGAVQIKATISPAGRVTSAAAAGSFAGTVTGECAARAVKRAKFPTAQEPTTIVYPFQL